MFFNNLFKMKASLAEMEELVADVKAGTYVPPKYRKDIKRFLEVDRFRYAMYLDNEIRNLTYRINQTEKYRNSKRENLV